MTLIETLHDDLRRITDATSNLRKVQGGDAIDGDMDIIDNALDSIDGMVDIIRQCAVWMDKS